MNFLFLKHNMLQVNFDAPSSSASPTSTHLKKGYFFGTLPNGHREVRINTFL